MTTYTAETHGRRVTHEATEDGFRFYVDCPCGAEAGPYATAPEARATDPHEGNEEPSTVATEGEAVAYLSREGGRVPCSRYGHDAASCAPVAWAAALIVARETEGGDPTTGDLDAMMGLVVNDHDDPETLIREHGPTHGIDPADYLEADDGPAEDGEAYAAYREYVGAEYATPEDFEDAYAGEWGSLEDYADDMAGELGWHAALEAVGASPSYLDVAAFARDLELGGDYWTTPAGPGRVHVFRTI